MYQRFTSLNDEDFEFLRAHTRYNAATIELWYESFKKDCPNRFLTREKYIEIYKKFFPDGDAEKFSEHVFRTFDTDHNGVLDFREFLLAINIMSGGSREEKLKWAFKVFDVAGNNVIHQDEMTKIIDSIYALSGMSSTNVEKPAEDRAKCMFYLMDENQDGKLTEKEFIQYCLKNEDLVRMLDQNMAQN